MPTKHFTRQSHGSTDCPVPADTNLVSPPAAVSSGTAMGHPTEQQSAEASLTQPTTSPAQEALPNGMSCIREYFRHTQIPADITKVLTASWRPGTQTQYATYLQKWVAFCSERQADYLAPSLNDALNFLLTLYNNGLSYSTLNTAHSALSMIIKIEGDDFGTNPVVTRFMKGVFETRLPTPKYNSIWDVSLVLRHLSKSYSNVTLPLKDLTYKVLMLLLLVSGQRGQSIHLLDLKHLSEEDQRYSFDILQHTKTSRPGVSPTRIEIARYDSDTTICPLSCLQEYINRTQQFRSRN